MASSIQPVRTTDQLSDRDLEIWRLRTRNYYGISRIAGELGISYYEVRKRLDTIRRMFPHPERDDLRLDTGHQLDELMAQTRMLAETSIEAGELAVARSALKDLGGLLRTKMDLFGLAVTDGRTPASADRIGDLLEQFRAGVEAGLDHAGVRT